MTGQPYTPLPRLFRVWEMPNASTFKLKNIQSLLHRFVGTGKDWVDPFSANGHWVEHTNDLNVHTTAASHVDAGVFLGSFNLDSMQGVLLDPPYSIRQITEKYDGHGSTIIKRFTKILDQTAKIVRPLGYVISCGWNSNGVGKSRGFELLEVVLIAHGGQHNDTIITVEQKLPITQIDLWDKQSQS